MHASLVAELVKQVLLLRMPVQSMLHVRLGNHLRFLELVKKTVGVSISLIATARTQVLRLPNSARGDVAVAILPLSGGVVVAVGLLAHPEAFEPSGLRVAFFQNGRRRRQQQPPTIYFRRRAEASRRVFRRTETHDICLEGGRGREGTRTHTHAHMCTCTCTCMHTHTKNGQGAWRGLLMQKANDREGQSLRSFPNDPKIRPFVIRHLAS
jgi:hypothetical protein